MRQRGGGPYLPQEPSPGILRGLGLLLAKRVDRSAGCARQRAARGLFHQLHRDAPVQAHVVAGPHLAHAALADRVIEAVPPGDHPCGLVP
jgi:hypothetical protein